MKRSLTSLSILAAAFLIPACGKSHSGGPPPQTGVAVSVSPAAATVLVGGVQSFTVTVSGTTEAAVTWSVDGIPGGNGAVGTIQATATGAEYSPTGVPNPDPVTVTATSQADTSASGNSTVTVGYPNDTATAQSLPIHLGTSGGNASYLTTSSSMTTCCSGTLGCLVRRDGSFFILSNNHVLDKSGQGTVGDSICQPGLVDSNCKPGSRVAALFQAAPLQTSNVDAALAQIVAGAVDTSGTIQDLGAAGSVSIDPAPPSATLADPASVLAANQRVAKAGRTTGLTCGDLLSINMDVQVDYSTSCAGPTTFTIVFHNQLLIDGGTFSEAGDSGALVVTSDAARPVGLLYAGNGSSTVASPIADVLAALKNASTGELPVIVGGADHAVSCAAVAPHRSSKSKRVETPPPTSLEFTRASDAKEKLGATLLEDPAVAGLGIGTSSDNPSEGAILVYVRGIPKSPLPHHLGGVRTKIVRMEEAGGAPKAQPTQEHLRRVTGIKEQHAAAFVGKNGVIGIGVGRSEDADGEPAVVLYVERSGGFTGVDVEIEGVRTRVIEGERFRTFGWGKPRDPASGCCGDR
jgi:hypothetical protein